MEAGHIQEPATRSSIQMQPQLLEWVSVALIFGVTSALSIVFQHPLTINGGKGWDGMYYYNMIGIVRTWITTGTAEYFSPYAYRVGTPLLVLLANPNDIFTGFKIVNQAAIITYVILFVVWLRYFVTDWRIRVLVSGLMITHYLGVVRWIYVYPINVDCWPLTLVTGALILMHRERLKPHWGNMAGLTLLSFIGLFFKESLIIIPTAFLIGNNPLKKVRLKPFSIGIEKPLYYSLPLIAAVAALGIMHKTMLVNEDYYVHYMILMILTRSPITFVVGLLYVFGPVLFLPFIDWKRQGKFLLAQPDLAVFIALGLVMTWFGTTDTERIALTISPMMYVLIGIAIENFRNVITVPLAALLGAAQVLAQRLVWTTPDYPSTAPPAWPIFVAQGNNVQFFDLFSTYTPGAALIAFGEYAVLFAVVIVWIQVIYRTRNPASAGLHPS